MKQFYLDITALPHNVPQTGNIKRQHTSMKQFYLDITALPHNVHQTGKLWTGDMPHKTVIPRFGHFPAHFPKYNIHTCTGDTPT
jgi:hypothetical protein